MRKFSQVVLIAATLLAAASVLQAFAQTGKAATTGNAEARKWGDWRDGKAKDQAELKREKLAGKNDGWKAWRDGKAKDPAELKRERLGGKNSGWKKWRDGKAKSKGEIRREMLAGKNDGWRRWRDGETNDDGRAYTGSVNINTASSTQLRRLPNVGPQTAASIIRNRPYRNIAQFRNANKRFISQIEWRMISRRVRL